jgi:hypothetical protein
MSLLEFGRSLGGVGRLIDSKLGYRGGERAANKKTLSVQSRSFMQKGTQCSENLQAGLLLSL